MEGLHTEEDLHSQALVWNHILAIVDTMVLKCALKLRLFDAIYSHSSTNHQISLTELATSLNIPPTRITTLHRIIRYLAHMRLLNITHEETYTLTTAASIYLRDGSEKSHAPVVRYLIEEDMLGAMHGLDAYLVEEGMALPIERVRGERFFEWVGRDEGLSKRFDDAMSCSTRPMIEAVVRGCGMLFEGVKVVVDVGGGTGNVGRAVVEAFPGVKCIVYDLPHVVKEGMEGEGVVFQAGDMFVSVPPADAFLLTRVLHDWSDEKALEILMRCREAIVGDKGKLIIVDTMIDENDSKDMHHIKLAYDILMMAYVGGKERTEKQWRSLLLQAGFSRCAFTRIMALQHVIEARP
ncbi:hypothetical protein IEQ34_002173 [Dendrobium chrysotoxum]|uniref:Uncharacterized protein n=1 Tax=Dendrobium chrysotoxum TaxID=161865 RepID=A0AAV7HJ18_DENCH|nr:hypothetical protein IEQ34_002173 [Dendrobium chrysotoxum]